MGKQTIITVDQAGNMKIDQQGFSGTACEEATAKLMAGIKAKARSDVKKPEYHNRSAANQTAQARRW